MIPLAILCAVLVAVVALGVKVARKRIAELNQEVVDALKDSKRAYRKREIGRMRRILVQAHI